MASLFARRSARMLAVMRRHRPPLKPFPPSPITIVIGYTPGAVSDLTARTIADGLHQAWGQPVIVDNRPGSGGNIGAGIVARARARRLHADGRDRRHDGQQPAPLQACRFDPVKDFAPVAYAGVNIICLAVNAELPIKSVADVIAYAKPTPASSPTAHPVSDRRIISPANCCARRPASTSSTCPIAAAARR